MMSTAWQLDKNFAQLSGFGWKAEIDLTRPDGGLSLQLADSANATNDPKAASPFTSSQPLTILDVVFGDQQQPQLSQVDAYIRGNDLVATYDEASTQCLRVQAYWRFLPPHEFSPDIAPHILAAFDLILSLNTSLLDSNPQSHVQSLIPCPGLIFHLQSSDSGTLRAAKISPPVENTNLNFTDDVNPSAKPGNNSAGCFIARLNRVPYSYVEMVHPADFCHSTINTVSQPHANTAATVIKHCLFQQRLEKGVILRARVRSAVVTQSYDESAAVTAYLNFAAAEPPLTA